MGSIDSVKKKFRSLPAGKQPEARTHLKRERVPLLSICNSSLIEKLNVQQLLKCVFITHQIPSNSTLCPNSRNQLYFLHHGILCCIKIVKSLAFPNAWFAVHTYLIKNRQVIIFLVKVVFPARTSPGEQQGLSSPRFGPSAKARLSHSPLIFASSATARLPLKVAPPQIPP